MEENRNVEVRETIYYGNRPPSRKKNKKSKKPLIIFLVILGCCLLLGIALAAAGISGNSEEGSGASNVNENFVGVLYIEGTIASDDADYNHEYVLDAIEGMRENDKNKGILLYVNTPGGGVYESDEVYLSIRDYQEETGRPVYVYMASQATSGGYYISAPADKILANRNCWTGSIGVTMGTLFDISELLDEYGIKTETITSGDNKSMGSMTEPLTSEQKKILQSMVDEAYDQFVGIVAEGRNMNEKEVRKVADGRLYTAKQAKEIGLVDEVVETYDDAVTAMTSDCKLGNCEFHEFKYEAEYDIFGSLIESINKLAEASDSQSDINALIELMEKDGQMPLQYMCEVIK